MGAWIIWLLLFGCNCNTNNRSSERSCGCDSDERGRSRDRDCGCDNDNSRFEPRFDTRPFGNRETCGCEDKD